MEIPFCSPAQNIVNDKTVGRMSRSTNPLVIRHHRVIDLIKVPNPGTQTNTLDASLGAFALLASTKNINITHRSFSLLERRRLPTGIFQRFLRRSHGILSEPSHLPLVLPPKSITLSTNTPIQSRRDDNNHHVHLCLAILKPSSRLPAGGLQVPQRQSDKASPRTEHRGASH